MIGGEFPSQLLARGSAFTEKPIACLCVCVCVREWREREKLTIRVFAFLRRKKYVIEVHSMAKELRLDRKIRLDI